MAYDADYLFALKLQEELDREEDRAAAIAAPPPPPLLKPIAAPKRAYDISYDENLNATQNLVHPEWENIDPTPDIHSLFGAFDIKFFQGKLKCVELEWSKRMYQCAGICYQRSNRMGKSITIRLSEPLLKLRSRRNLIETLLHEMIHAYLFILNIREGNGGHGPSFVKIMTGINRTAGTDISVYHSFHDEVNLYKTHVWRCNGICQHRAPFFGWVKRTCNRAPGPNDIWWQRHHESCGGVFQKISEPEPKQKAKKPKKAIETAPTIPTWAQPTATKAGSGMSTKVGGSIGSKTIVIKPPPKPQNIRAINDTNAVPIAKYVPPKTAGGNLTNVIGFKDLNGSPSGQPKPNFPTGSGRPLNAAATGSGAADTISAAERIKSIWSQKFTKPVEVEVTPKPAPSDKRGYVETKPTQKWEDVDDDIMVWEEKHPIIDICDDDSNDSQTEGAAVVPPKHERTFQPDAIRKELFDDLGDSEDVIELIDDEFDDAQNESIHILTDTSVLDDIFGEDTLMADFHNINNVVMKDPENRGNPKKEIITCPICQDQMCREELSCHLEGCTGITVKVEIKPKSKAGTKAPRQLPFYKNHATGSAPSTSRSVQRVNFSDIDNLRKAGYTEAQIQRIAKEKAEEKDYNARIMDEMAAEERNRRTQPNARAPPTATVTTADIEAPMPITVPCPVCNQMFSTEEINAHLDLCLALD